MTMDQKAEQKPNYSVHIFSRIDFNGRIGERHFQDGRSFVGILDALDWIKREAEVNGWRDFSLETVGDNLERPLRGQ